MQLLIVRLASVLIISFVYMLFDIFNKRNVPGVFAYGTLIYGAALTVAYFNVGEVLVSTAIALFILGIGYFIYKVGQFGAADIIEIAALSLILPIQQVPIVSSRVMQFGLPFAVSVILASGIAAMVIVPVYYIPKARKLWEKSFAGQTGKRNAFKAILILIFYAAFILFLFAEASLSTAGLLILLIMMFGSSAILLFEKPITDSMVEMVTINRCEEGDMVAFNLMDSRKINSIKGRVKGFDRLLTRELIAQMKAKRIRDKIPVYKNALPFALPIFIGVVLSILFGNLIFFVLLIL